MNGFDVPDLPLRIREWIALALLAVECAVFAWLSIHWTRPIGSDSHRDAPERAVQLHADALGPPRANPAGSQSLAEQSPFAMH
jgi:hypothetical protein